MEEIAKTILNGCFEVTNTGKIYKLTNGTKKEATISYTSRNKKYGVVTYYNNGKQKHQYVHRLIAEAFIPNIENKPQINHIDGNTRNNKIDNLEWVTAKENTVHAYRTGLMNPQKQRPKCKLCENIVLFKNTVCKPCREKRQKNQLQKNKNKAIDSILLNDDLTDYQRKLLNCRKDGLTVIEIAKSRGCTHQSVSQVLRNVKEKYNIQEII